MTDAKKSFFMEYIFPTLLQGAVASGVVVVTLYFTVRTLGDRVSALETTAARTDVIGPQLSTISDNIKEIKEDSRITREDIKELLKR